MSDDEGDARFRFNFGELTLELTGEREFVERMYHRVMKDVETVRLRCEEKLDADEVVQDGTDESSVWLHRCGNMMRKIYMCSRDDIMETPLGEVVGADKISAVYLDKDTFAEFFRDLEDGYTLWAEFTSVGRQKIEEATAVTQQALDPDSTGS